MRHIVKAVSLILTPSMYALPLFGMLAAVIAPHACPW